MFKVSASFEHACLQWLSRLPQVCVYVCVGGGCVFHCTCCVSNFRD